MRCGYKLRLNASRPSTRGLVLTIVSSIFLTTLPIASATVQPPEPRLLRDGVLADAKELSLNLAPEKTNSAANTERIRESYGKLPLTFEVNEGQTDPRVKFLSRAGSFTVFFTADEAVFVLKRGVSNRSKPPRVASSRRSNRDVLRMKLVGAKPLPTVSAFDEKSHKSNYFIGNDPAKWRTNVSNFGGVKYENVYPGIDLIYRGNQQQQLEYDFRVSAGTNPRSIVLQFDGAQSMRIDKDGALVLSVKGEEVRHERPEIYQENGNERIEVSGHYRLLRSKRVSFEVEQYDTSRPLIIDPVLSYSTYLGGVGSSVFDFGSGIAVDAAGSAYVTGSTDSTNFPLQNAFQPTHGTDQVDSFVTKLSPSGSTLVYSTFLGGNGLNADQGDGIVVDSAGNAYSTGYTGSDSFPTTAGAARACTGSSRKPYVTKLDPSGSALVYSTCLGNDGSGEGHGIAIDSLGQAYVTGYTGGGLSSVNALQPVRSGPSDGFLIKLNTQGSTLLYSSYFGGSNDDQGTGIDVDSLGNVYIVGGTNSTNLPRANAYQQTFAGSNDAFVAKFTPNGASFSLAYSTYLGGNDHDWGYGIAVDSSGNTYLTGETTSINFPTLNAYQSSVGGNIWNAFVSKFDTVGGLVWSTYLGGTNVESGKAIAVDSSGSAYVTGSTSSTDFPTLNPVRAYSANNDVFVTKFDPSGGSIVFSTYVGGSQSDSGTAIALDSSGNAYVTGATQSANFPVSNAFQSFLRGSSDAFVLRISGFVGFDIRGRVTNALGAGLSGVTITLTGTSSDTKQTDANGEYAFVTLQSGGNFTITPTKAPYTFSPASRTYNNLSTEQQADFTVVTYSISGRVTDPGAQGAGGVLLSLTGTQTGTVTTDGGGFYSFPAVAGGGSYTLTPSRPDYVLTYSFAPVTRSFSNLSANQTGVDFSFTTSTRVSLDALADAYVQDGTSANTNFGAANPLQVKSDNTAGQRRDAYLKYSLTPVRRSIVNAKLRIYAALSASGSVGTSVFSVSDTTWTETAMTWNNKPLRGTTALSTVTVTGTAFASYDLDVTSYVLSERAAGRDTISLALHNASNSTPFINLNSREAAANKPQLVITTSDNGNAAPTVSITAPADGAPFAALTNITINANASDTDGMVSAVDFYAGTSKIGTDTTAPYSIVWNVVEAGAYSLRAVATDSSGATATSNAVNITVSAANIQPSVSLTAPPTGLTIPAGGSIALSATASDVDGTVTKVEFFTGSTLIGSDTTSPYNFTWTNVPAGAHALTAVATDNSGATRTSSFVTLNAVWQTGLTPTADAYVRDGSSASTNFGTSTELQVQASATTGSNRESYLKFDLTPVSGITGAKLRLYGGLVDTSGTNVPATVYPLATGANQDWVESGSGSLTWNTRQSLGTALSTTTITNNVARWYEWDVTSYIQSEKIAGHTPVTLVVRCTTNSGPYATFNSKEAVTNSQEAVTNQPQLLITTTATRNILFVTGSSTPNTSESALKTRMENLGFTVSVKQAGSNQNTAINTTDAYGKAAVVISSTVTPANVAAKFRNVVVPVLLWESDLLDDQAMTGTPTTEYGVTSGTQITILDATHPLAAGQTGNVSVVAPASNLSWGKPNANAAKVASLFGDATKSTLFGYDTGAVMPGAGAPGVPAPARRVAFFLSDTNGTTLTDPQGKALFDAAIKWLTATIVAPVVSAITPTFGTIGTSVTISGYNFGDTQGASAITFNGVNATPTSWTSSSIVAGVPAGASSGSVLVVVSGLASNAITFTVNLPPVDTDGDGLPDAWELQYFGNLNQGANDNPDGDELNNLQEYLQGRNPTIGTVDDSGGGVNLRLYTPLIPVGP